MFKVPKSFTLMHIMLLYRGWHSGDNRHSWLNNSSQQLINWWGTKEGIAVIIEVARLKNVTILHSLHADQELETLEILDRRYVWKHHSCNGSCSMQKLTRWQDLVYIASHRKWRRRRADVMYKKGRDGGEKHTFLGLLAKIKCSICSDQVDIWYEVHRTARD